MIVGFRNSYFSVIDVLCQEVAVAVCLAQEEVPNPPDEVVDIIVAVHAQSQLEPFV